jgi:Ca-activated chloride channel family protein
MGVIMMRQLLRIIIISFAIISIANANGVAVVNAETETYFRLVSTHVDVSVENQVSITTTTQIFLNQTGADTRVRYAFPLPEGGSAVSLKWNIAGEWYQAVISPIPQDTTTPGGVSTVLNDYLGPNPLFFSIIETVHADSELTVELQYVELLDYTGGFVYYTYPNDYHLIQPEYLDFQTLEFHLSSDRSITNISLESLTADSSNLSANNADLYATLYESPAVIDFEIIYELSLEELGLFSLSTSLPDSLVPDEGGHGYFVFVAEPDPHDTAAVIEKVFTLVVDRSGSMSGTKMVQAKDAAGFIVNHLNPGDRFNIVDFASDVSAFQNMHILYTPTSESEALSYIAGMTAGGGTNISGALDTAITQFGLAVDSTANIIIFFTDGQATAGITITEDLVAHINQVITQSEISVTIYCFGIGGSVNEQLLTLIASNTGGIADFLGDEDLESSITDFYLKIRDPVLLNTQMTFSIPVITETYPATLPSLFRGEQLIVTGRYSEAIPITVTLSGQAQGQDVDYEYTLALADSFSQKYQFLTKVWAKGKIEDLLIQYYSEGEGTPAAEVLKNQIIAVSVSYGVISPFTSFTGGIPVGIEEGDDPYTVAEALPEKFRFLGNHPNPFNAGTAIRFEVLDPGLQMIEIRIYNVLGQVIKRLVVPLYGPGIYEVFWDGITQAGVPAASGMYIVVFDYDAGLAAMKIILSK